MDNTLNALALASAAQANATADEAARIACAKYVVGYTHDSATVAEMRDYAGCIDRLYGSDVDVDVLKPCAIVILIAMIIGIVKFWRTRKFSGEGAIETVIAGAATGFVAGSVVCLLGAIVWFAVKSIIG